MRRLQWRAQVANPVTRMCPQTQTFCREVQVREVCTGQRVTSVRGDKRTDRELDRVYPRRVCSSVCIYVTA